MAGRLGFASMAWMADNGELRAILTFWGVVFTGVGLHGIVLRRLAEPSPRAHSILGVVLAAGLAAGTGYAVELAITTAPLAVAILRETMSPVGPAAQPAAG